MPRLGRLAWSVLRRLVPPPDPEAVAAISAVFGAARRAAESPLGDEEARKELEAAVAEHPDGIEQVLALWRGQRDDYVKDRAFRLLSAVASGGPVEPMPVESAEQFERERELGQLPLREAFARLKELYPYLAGIEEDVIAGRVAVPPVKGGSGFEVPLGRTFGHADPLLRSDLALNVAIAYLDAIPEAPGSMVLDTPFFSAPRRKGVSTGMLLGRPTPPP